jgi:hypothetical protein
MTLQEGRKRLFEYVENEVKKSGCWIFNKRKIELTITRILQPYERTANFPLPDKIEETDFIIDKEGITSNEICYTWETICATGIKTETIYKDENLTLYINHLVCILHSEKIQEFQIDKLEKYKGNLGHYIELYKQTKF